MQFGTNYVALQLIISIQLTISQYTAGQLNMQKWVYRQAYIYEEQSFL